MVAPRNPPRPLADPTPVPRDTVFPAVGRLLIALPFIMWGMDMLWDAPRYIQPFQTTFNNIPVLGDILVGPTERTVLILFLSGLVVLVCALALAFGFATKLSALPLAVFLLIGTLMYYIDFRDVHTNASNGNYQAAATTFWSLITNLSEEARLHIVKNLAIVGGLCLVTSHGAGRLALDLQSPTSVGWAAKKTQ
eukprot:TRINITY_DN57338_c0_g1_i1.p1 TRINITY_DN57338_c0_g1~~TRINITY_DN57338_c0_g1_i1.p1  ORF type:complete len:219 (-),score=25.67 TRINITY_DN57338_c0_g1_i1:438-1019(-)